MKSFNTGNIVNLSHDFLEEVVGEGDWALDATLGNGNDAVFLAELVGKSGRIFGFDIQEDAIRKSKVALEARGASKRFELFQSCHSRLGEHLKFKSKIKGIVYNLGYLPGSDRSISTQSETTLMSLEQAKELLSLGGRIVLVTYNAHPGGLAEAKAVSQFATKLEPSMFRCFKVSQVNLSTCPELIVIERKI